MSNKKINITNKTTDKQSTTLVYAKEVCFRKINNKMFLKINRKLKKFVFV